MGQKGGVSFTHHIECEKEGERRHSQVSVLCVKQWRSERAQMGNQNNWIIECLKSRTSVITNLDELVPRPQLIVCALNLLENLDQQQKNPNDK